ncbi:MAG: formylglycine-generating enzyme family protein [Desulfovibrio sp.]|jgi:formylglycine-generating enzyme required for sulfatase activity|nr:formylglycine-generating enzyme family protein [Desulfovibrio sp.]
MRKTSIIFTVLCLPLLFAGTADAFLGIGQKTETNGMGMEFVQIPAGSFFREINIVNDFNEKLYSPKVIVSKPFFLGKYEVTQEQWMTVMGNNPSSFKGRKNPVESVSWDDVQEFIKRLNAREGTNRYRLPTEAEWELAARGGTDTMFFFMKNPETFEEVARPLGDYAWFLENAGGATHPVGEKKPNPYGLYDIYGNVWEWVQDWYTEKLPTDREITDYRGPAQGSLRVVRGGGWSSLAEYCRSGDRRSNAPVNRDDRMGFRLAFSPE